MPVHLFSFKTTKEVKHKISEPKCICKRAKNTFTQYLDIDRQTDGRHESW